MVTASVAALALLALGNAEVAPSGSSTPPLLGVVRVARGRVTLSAPNGESRAARTGDLLRPGMRLETPPSGWAEAHLLDTGRVRLSASTRITLGANEDSGVLLLEHGRVWVQATGKSDVRLTLADAHCWIARKSSAIVELTRTGGGSIAVREGVAGLGVGTGAVQIARGHVATWLSDQRSVSSARSGGYGIGALVAQEARDGLGDLIGLKAFLLERVERAEVSRTEPRKVTEILRSTPEISGGDSGPAGRLVEEGLRPPPFFENEVPPKGPNVRVEVTYGE